MFELTQPERQFLLEVLQDRLGTLREQIHHAIISKFSDHLKEQQKLLRGLIAKLEAGNCVTAT